ncbi:MAG TPA: YbgA family protein, partial [Vicinamibacteria bacterium]|nr:YbgA family protein [Vicinamibacteria bacterium]
AYQRLRRLFAGRWTQGQLVAFHTTHKMLLLAHLPAAYSSLGRLVAGGRRRDREDLARRYQEGFMAALARPSTRRLHTNVLQHMVGHFRGLLDASDRDELLGLIEDHRRGLSPLVVPVTLLRHHARRLGVEYLLGQVYLDPHPKELMLLNRT